MDGSDWEYVVKHKHKKKKNKATTDSKAKQSGGNEKNTKEFINYLLKNYRVKLCKKSKQDHDVTTCINAHNESELRRYPFRDGGNEEIAYSKYMCDDNSKGMCKLQNNCLKSHNEAEKHFHPAIYKTQLCARNPCQKLFCYFAHGTKELRCSNTKFENVKIERNVTFAQFVSIPKPKKIQHETIEIIRDWTGWKNRLGSAELLPCPMEDVFSRMLKKYPELHVKIKEICFNEGCTPFVEYNQHHSSKPVSLLIQGVTKEAICAATTALQSFLETCRAKTVERFPPRFLRYTECDADGVKLLKELCSQHLGIDISVNTRANTLCVWGRNLKQRRNILYKLKTVCTNFALTDAQAIADAKFSSLEEELRQTQQQLQAALQEKHKLVNHLKFTENLVLEITDSAEPKGEKDSSFYERGCSRPSNWQSKNDYSEHRLEKDTEEWDQVHSKFIATIGKYRLQVTAITRIENHDLWQHYELLKQKIQVEKQLWHGSSKESIHKICKGGFNRSYAGMHAVKYGRGTYFAKTSEYSSGYSERDRCSGERYMILSKVLVGRYVPGDPKMTALPEYADSAVNETNNPTIYVIFKDFQAYPAYVVKFNDSP